LGPEQLLVTPVTQIGAQGVDTLGTVPQCLLTLIRYSCNVPP